MPLPLLRTNVISNALNEFNRMDDRRGHTTQLDERRLKRALDQLDDSLESAITRAAIDAIWRRDFLAADTAIERLIDARSLSHPESLYVNFSLMSLRNLNVALGTQLNHLAFATNRNEPEFLNHVLRNAWMCGDLATYESALAKLSSLKANDHDQLAEPFGVAKRVLSRHGLTFEIYHAHVKRVVERVRALFAGRIDAQVLFNIAPETFDDGQQELVIEFDLGVDDTTLDTIDEEILNLLSDPEQVHPELNMAVGVLVRDYSLETRAEAC